MCLYFGADFIVLFCLCASTLQQQYDCNMHTCIHVLVSVVLQGFCQRVKMIFRFANCIVSKRPNWPLWFFQQAFYQPRRGRRWYEGVQYSTICHNFQLSHHFQHTHTHTQIHTHIYIYIVLLPHFPFSSCTLFSALRPRSSRRVADLMWVYITCVLAVLGNCLFVIVAENRISRADWFDLALQFHADIAKWLLLAIVVAVACIDIVAWYVPWQYLTAYEGRLRMCLWSVCIGWRVAFLCRKLLGNILARQAVGAANESCWMGGPPAQSTVMQEFMLHECCSFRHCLFHIHSHLLLL